MSSSRAFCVTILALAAVVAACGGDSPTKPTPSVRLAGDTMVSVAGTISLAAEGTDSAGALVTQGFLWQSSDVSVATVSQEGMVMGRAPGTVTITVDAGFARGSRTVIVRDDRPAVPLAVGGSVTGRVVSGIATERIAVSVTAGDTLDLLVRLDSADALLFGSHLRSAETPWLRESVRTSQGITLYGAVVPSATGTYLLEAVGDMICGGRYCVPPSGSYVVRVRRSAPIFNVSRYYERAFLTLPEGALGRDSVWAQNVGVGTATVRATSPVSWLRPDSVAVALVGPKVGGATPDVATAIGATVDARGVAQGAYDESLDLDASTGEWSPFRPFGHHFRRVQLRVTDSSARLLSAAARLPRLAAGSDGKLYGAVNDSVLAIDPVSGALSLVVRLPFQPTQLAVGADGALYVRRQSVDAGGVYKITNGSAELVLDLRPSDGPFAVLPDGTIYGFSGPALYRGSPGGAQQRVATFTFSDYPSSIVYRAADDALYIVYGGQLWRHDRARAETTVRGTVTEIGTFRLYAVDAQGRLYGTVPYVKQEVRVLDVDGGVLDRRVLADIPQALTISGGTIFVTTGTSLWRLPVR